MKRAEHLVTGDVKKAEPVFAFRRQSLPVGARGLQKRVRADDVGLNELTRAVDRAIDVRLRGKMHHGIRSVSLEHVAHRCGVGDVRLQKEVPRTGLNVRQRVQVPGIGEFVHVDNRVRRVQQEMTHEV